MVAPFPSALSTSAWVSSEHGFATAETPAFIGLAEACSGLPAELAAETGAELVLELGFEHPAMSIARAARTAIEKKAHCL